MPSLRHRVSSYLRQLSFIDEPRGERNGNSRFAASALSPNHNITNGDCFIVKFLEGLVIFVYGYTRCLIIINSFPILQTDRLETPTRDPSW